MDIKNHCRTAVISATIWMSIVATIMPAKAQEVPLYIANQEVYLYLEELATLHIIEINSAVKPWSRMLVAKYLSQAEQKRNLLNHRQQKMLDFYLKDFGKELHGAKNFNRRFDALYFKDTLFSITINPILGGTIYNNSNGTIYHRYGGAETYGYIGPSWGFFASLRDNHESERISEDTYLTQRMGANYKNDGKGGDYSEMRGGVTYSWSWGSIMVGKDHLVMGTSYNGSNILSGRTPSFPLVRLRIKPVKWVELNYIHGWLVSEVVDSSRTSYFPNGKRTVYHPKYIAANLITIIPVKNLGISFGNSIIYSDQAPSPAYLAPLFFYKSVDHTLNGMNNDAGQNSQMFFDISSHQIKYLHLYSTLFLDEISLKRMFNKKEQSNFYSIKVGGRITNWPVKNVALTVEYTRTHPLTFRHYEPTTTFENDKFNLGHYLTDNADEIFISIEVRPLKGLRLLGSYTKSRKGPDYSSDINRLGLPFMESVVWHREALAFNAQYQLQTDSFIFLELCKSNIVDHTGGTYTPNFFLGAQTTLSLGINYGF